MKILLTLILFIPLLSFSQEAQMAHYSTDSTWVFGDSVILNANNGLDSIKVEGMVWDSIKYYNDTFATIYGHQGTSVVLDLISVTVVDTVMYTDFLSGGCATICKNAGCIDCYKKADCSGCGCNDFGDCIPVNYGIDFKNNFSNVLREQMILSIGNTIPEE